MRGGTTPHQVSRKTFKSHFDPGQVDVDEHPLSLGQELPSNNDVSDVRPTTATKKRTASWCGSILRGSQIQRLKGGV